MDSPNNTCVCKNNAPPVLQPILRRSYQCCRQGAPAVLKQIRGGSFQCWDGLTAAAQKFLPNIKERLFCKRPHHRVLKTDIALLAPVGLVVLSTARTDVGLDNIEEGGGRSVSEVSERCFCKHRNGFFLLRQFSCPFFRIALFWFLLGDDTSGPRGFLALHLTLSFRFPR